MKAISLTQPWATLVAIKAKELETRDWATRYHGPLAIHASKGFPKWAKDYFNDARFLAKHREGKPSRQYRCMACGFDTSTGWEYDASRELSAIDNWLHDWRNGMAIGYELTRRKEIEQIRKENEAKPRGHVWKHG